MSLDDFKSSKAVKHGKHLFIIKGKISASFFFSKFILKIFTVGKAGNNLLAFEKRKLPTVIFSSLVQFFRSSSSTSVQVKGKPVKL